MEPVLAVYDACVLYPAPLRDLLLHLAGVGLVGPRWTDAIHKGDSIQASSVWRFLAMQLAL